MRRYHIQDRDDYKKYNKICGIITKLVSVLKRLDAQDPERIELTDQVLSKCAAPRERLKCIRLPCTTQVAAAACCSCRPASP